MKANNKRNTNTDTTREQKCVICHEPIIGFGNNPYPVKKRGLCCNECDILWVTPARIALALSKGIRQ